MGLKLSQAFKGLESSLKDMDANLRTCPLKIQGQLTRSVGLTLEAKGFVAPIGSVCLIDNQGHDIQAVVSGFSDDKLFLMPIDMVDGLPPHASITPSFETLKTPVGQSLLGRVIDSCGKPLDGQGPLGCTQTMPLYGQPINPLKRRPITEPLDLGVSAINALLTVGVGQRVGLFAGSGVGKSVLMGMLARYTAADVIVVGLIGERGREVKEFIELNLGDAIKKAVVVAAPADYPPLLRLNGAWAAMTIAEYFRNQGKNVLLLMDSLTRFSQAQREIGLAMNEPPATKGYPPSAFALLPRLIERAGTGEEGGGAITAIFTVLAEGDDQQDPIVDAARAVLDGHFVLSRKYAELGHYPAIDIEASVSRVMNSIVSPEHQNLARQFKKYYALYLENQDLISMGAYVNGSQPELDFAIANMGAMRNYLHQAQNVRVEFKEALNRLMSVMSPMTHNP